MINAALSIESRSVSGARPTTFSAVRIQQIHNLVERGKSRDEIAEMIGVAPGTLEVACSKLGISLRRPRLGLVGGSLPRQRMSDQNKEKAYPNRSNSQGRGPKLEQAKQVDAVSQAPTEGARTPVLPERFNQGKMNEEGPAVFAIRLEYNGKERSTGLPLDEEMIGQLALEAEIRGMRIGELIAALILAIVKNDLFRPIRDC